MSIFKHRKPVHDYPVVSVRLSEISGGRLALRGAVLSALCSNKRTSARQGTEIFYACVHLLCPVSVPIMQIN